MAYRNAWRSCGWSWQHGLAWPVYMLVCMYVCMYVCARALLQYMLPYAFTRHVEMHGDFTGGVGSLAWLGFRGGGGFGGTLPM